MAPGRRTLRGSHQGNVAVQPGTIDAGSQIAIPDSSNGPDPNTPTGLRMTKKGRGASSSLSLKKCILKNGGNKLPVYYPEGKRKPVGIWASMFTSELGVLCRKGKYLEAKTWGAVPLPEKEKIYIAIKGSFDIDFSLNVLEAVEAQLGILYKQWMYRLHMHYAKYRSMEEAIRHPYRGVGNEHWEKLCCDHFSDEKFKKKSRTNKSNRSKRKINGRLGSRSYVNHRYITRNKETHEELSSIDFWEEVHNNRDTKKWSCERAKELYDEMIQLQQQPVEEGEMPLTEKETVERVLQKESGYVLGLGYGEKRPPSSKLRQDYADEFDLAKSREEEAERRAEAAERRAEEAEKRLDDMDTELGNVKGTLVHLTSIMEKFGAGLLGGGHTGTGGSHTPA